MADPPNTPKPPKPSEPSVRRASAGTGIPSGTAGPSAQSNGAQTGGDRDRFEAHELAIVLSHYETGVIESIQEFPRGSRRAPKLILRTEKGVFLLKRRARGRDDAFKVAFSHGLQIHLASRQFPLPHLIGTRNENNSMLQWKGTIYELFEYISGTGYDNSLEATQDAGKTLALFHKLIRDYQPDYEPARGSYHATRMVSDSLSRIPRTLAQVDPDTKRQGTEVHRCVQFIGQAYQEAAKKANDIGLTNWPMQIIHSDWHPGNMLFRGPRVVAVIDYDAARFQQRIIDTANGALQFSILGGGDDASQWPEYLDESRFKRFLRGYDSVNQLSRGELRCVPWLMVEALITESVIPIATAGSFSRMEGFGFLQMIERKVRWLQKNADRLASVLDDD